MEKLQQLLDEGVIDEVFNQLKTGKEAEVWLVSHHGEPVAAKIYKAREFRSFKNDAGYKEGRQVRNTRTQRAMDKGSKFGRESSEEAWKSMESDTMFSLHAAGVRCPKPVLFYEGVLLMEVIGDAEGRVAPRLVEAVIPREQAEAMYVTLRQEVIKMLSEDVIHGDLSEFNILLGATGPVIIDFPQVITAAKNSQSEKYFRRDLGNLLRFFNGIDAGLEVRHLSDADEIWREYVRRDLSPVFVPSGRRPQAGGSQGRGFQGGRGGFQQGGRNGGGGAQQGPGGFQQGGRNGAQQGNGRGGFQQNGRNGAQQGGNGAQPGGDRGGFQQGGRNGAQQGGGRGAFQQTGRSGAQHGNGGAQPGGERGGFQQSGRNGAQQGNGGPQQGGERGGFQQSGRNDVQPGNGGAQPGGDRFQQGGRNAGPQQGQRNNGPQQGNKPGFAPQGPRGPGGHPQRPREPGGKGGRPQGPVVERKPQVNFRPAQPARPESGTAGQDQKADGSGRHRR